MSRRRNRNTNKANNSNLVGLAATIIKEGDKNKGKRVLIQEVNNDIAKVLLLDDKEMNKFYLPVSDLRPFSRERSIECLLENVIDDLRMDIVNKAINGDKGKRHSDTSSLVQGLANIVDCFSEFAKWCESDLGYKDNNDEPVFDEQKDEHENDSELNYSNHVLEGGDLIVKCSKFCRDYKISPIYFIGKLSEHLYYMHERYAPKDKK